jgi:ABC-2 type transport system permease protein
VVNSYFDILVAYGDQHEVLNYRDLIDIKVRSETDLDVALKNPEYDVTRAVRKVLASYQGGGNPFETLNRPITFTGYLSAAQNLPANLQDIRLALEGALEEIRRTVGDKFQAVFADPDADEVLAKQLTTEFGFRPLIAGLLDPKPFWFYLVLSDGREKVPVPLPQDLDQAGFRRALEAAVKRFSAGFLKTVAVWKPPATPEMPGLGGFSGGQRFSVLRDFLSESVRWLETDLADGRVPSEADLLMVLTPENLDEKQRFAIDQFLMQGGSVLLATAPIAVEVGQGIDVRPIKSGLEDWLASQGLALGAGLVLDPRCGSLPIPVERRIGGFTVREIQLIDYPYISDVRGTGLHPASPITASLGQIFVPWGTPIIVDAAKNQGRKVTELLRSSPESWVSESQDLVPDLRTHPRLGFAQGQERASQMLAVMVEGRFASAFQGKNSPLLEGPEEAENQTTEPVSEGTDTSDPPPAAAKTQTKETVPVGVIEHSLESARLILVSTNHLFTDQTEALVGQALGTHYLKPAEFAQNLVDWSVEDQGLLGIRSRSHFARTLAPLDRELQKFWEYLNYGLALAGLVLVWFLHRRYRQAIQARHSQILQEV